jgi:hypothetical protein
MAPKQANCSAQRRKRTQAEVSQDAEDSQVQGDGADDPPQAIRRKTVRWSGTGDGDTEDNEEAETEEQDSYKARYTGSLFLSC